MGINTINEFESKVYELLKSYGQNYKLSLDEYLRSLWGLILEHRNEEFNFTLLASLLEQAFSSKPVQFEESWFSYTEPANFQNFKDDFDCLKKTILFQISDLRRMDMKGMLKNELKYFGIESPTEHIWYNFDPHTYLKCAISGLKANFECGRINGQNIKWTILARFLELGRIYE